MSTDEWSGIRAQRAEKTSERIARAILQDVRRRNLQPGDPIGLEHTLLTRFGVGKASLREALRILEMNGLVSIKTGATGGPIVRRPSSGDFGRTWMLHMQTTGTRFDELVTSRVELEPLLARQAAAEPTDADVARLRAALDRETSDAPDAEQRYTWSHIAFHSAVFQAARNPALTLVAEALRDICVTRLSPALFPPDQRGRVHEVHEQITDAIVARDADAAEKHMRAHLEQYQALAAERYPARLDETVEWS